MFTRLIRQAIAKVCIAALLFVQMAVAAYACQLPAHQMPDASPAAEHRVMSAGCEDMAAGGEVTNLCHEHCQAGNQSVQTSSNPIPPVVLSVMALIELAPVPAALPSVIQPGLLARLTGPPPSIRFQVFRI